MRLFRAIFLCAIAVCAGAQERGSSPAVLPSVPKLPCRYDRLSMVREVKGSPPTEVLMRFDLSTLTENRVFFPIGAEVLVSRREGVWSCVSGSMKSSSGWTYRNGWTLSSLLGPLDAESGSEK